MSPNGYTFPSKTESQEGPPTKPKEGPDFKIKNLLGTSLPPPTNDTHIRTDITRNHH